MRNCVHLLTYRSWSDSAAGDRHFRGISH